MSVLVSAVITTHNRKQLLKRAIDSVLLQTYNNLECIVIDDASVDGTNKYIEDYITTEKIRYIYIPPDQSKGGNYARNQGILASNGEYVAFLDDDDEWLPEKIELQVAAISNRVEFIYTGAIIEKNYVHRYDDSCNRKYYEGNLSKEILVHILTVTSTIMVKKEILIEVGLFDENLKYWQEYDLCIRVLQKTNAKCINKGLVLYRIVTTDNKRLSNKILGWEDTVKYIESKYNAEIEALSCKDKNRRLLYVCIDGVNRAKKAKSFYYLLKYSLFYPLKHPGIIMEFIIKACAFLARKKLLV